MTPARREDTSPMPPTATPIVFIANRGEIAVRVIRAAKDLGYHSAVVYVDDDIHSPYVDLADHAVRVEADPNPFLDAETMVSAALRAQADFLHPGYGFLAENPDFAERVSAAGITWVGPRAAAIAALGDKVSARAIAKAAGAPLVVGSDGPVSGAEDIREFARAHGFPLAVKASYGGGGRGMRVIYREADIESQLAAARSEAIAAFGNGECFVEQYLEHPRHVETQCLADAHGTIAVVGTRDCSLQRRHQKLVEEAPAPGLTDEQLRILTEASRGILSLAGYEGAATCEFLISQQGVISFLEVNTRIQVEHTVTELVSGVDLIEQQFRIARGEALAVPDHVVHGVAFEFRINSEDASRGFLPSTGIVTAYTEPSGPWVRVDSGICIGSEASGAFDSMLAKLIVTAPDRERALHRSRRAIEEFRIDGVSTTLPLHRALVDEPLLRHHGSEDGGVYTNWIEESFFADGGADRIAFHRSRVPRWNTPAVEAVGAASSLSARDDSFSLRIGDRDVEVTLPDALLARLRSGSVLSPAPTIPGLTVHTDEPVSYGTVVPTPARGIVVALHVAEGTIVSEGDALVTLEVMKMEFVVTAPSAGTVSDLASLGAALDANDPLLVLL